MTQMSLFADLAPASSNIPVVIPTTANPMAEKPTSKQPQQDTLMKLAELIRHGREQMETQSRRRSRPVQSIGDLAQAVLKRHDLVAQRRAASLQAASQHAASLRDTSGQANLADTPSEVHVAS